MEANHGHHQSTKRFQGKAHNECDADPEATEVPLVSGSIPEGEELSDREDQPEHETYEAYRLTPYRQATLAGIGDDCNARVFLS